MPMRPVPPPRRTAKPPRGCFLERPERTLRVVVIERRVSLERLSGELCLAHVGEAPQSQFVGPVSACYQKPTVSVNQPIRQNTLAAPPSRRSSQEPETAMSESSMETDILDTNDRSGPECRKEFVGSVSAT